MAALTLDDIKEITGRERPPVPERFRGVEEGPELTEDDELALDRAWSQVAEENGTVQIGD